MKRRSGPACGSPAQALHQASHAWARWLLPCLRELCRRLPGAGSMTRAEIEQSYAIGRRIEAEERCLDNAMMVFTSTQQEIDEQWGL